ncbi:MAG: hypothetical protein C4320_07810, partial [Armatimonadota bacterium]
SRSWALHNSGLTDIPDVSEIGYPPRFVAAGNQLYLQKGRRLFLLSPDGSNWSALNLNLPPLKSALKIGINDRALQRQFLKTVDGRVNGNSASRTDFKPLAKARLREVARAIDAAMPRAKDVVTAAHLVDIRADIVKILEDRYSKPGGSPSFSLMDLLMGGLKPMSEASQPCWIHPLPAEAGSKGQ